MHVFQPYPIKDIELNPFTIQGKTGLCITTEAEGKTNAMVTTNIAFGKLWKKDVCFVFVRDKRYTRELLDDSEFFSITFFEDKFTTALKYLKSVSGRQEDKIKQAGFNVNRHLDIPFLDEGNFVVLCNKIACFNMKNSEYLQKHVDEKFYPQEDYHHVYVGEILEMMAR